MSTKLIVNRDIIIVGQQPWDTEIGSNCKDIAVEFSKHNRVLYVNAPLDRITSIRNRNTVGVIKRLNIIKGKENGLVQISKNLWNLYPDCLVESINWIKNKTVFDLINRKNNQNFAKSIKAGIAKLGFKNYLLFNDNELIKSFYLIEHLKPKVSAYYSRDFIVATPYWAKHGKRLEPLLISKNDICLSNSEFLASYCKQYNPNSFNVGQGCDLATLVAQSETPKPKDLEKITGPIIGYVGALLVNRLDMDVIQLIAKEKPEWNIVLVGPEDQEFRSSNLHNYSNVHFIGSKQPNELGGYINHFDVCINPQIINDLTIGNYPRKVDEYLGFGKPVVATETLAMQLFTDHVYLAKSKEEYVLLIERAMQENSIRAKKERIEFALSHSWENCIDKIYQKLQKADF